MYSNEDKALALSMWLSGKDFRTIETEMGINKLTLIRWSEKDNWNGKKEEHLNLLNKSAVEDIAAFKLKMINQLEGLRDILMEDSKLCKAPTKDKIVNNILDLNKQLLLLRGIPTDISKVESKVDIKKTVKLEDLV
ncbi:hypothetical protein [Acetivibrio cellulolyticus]|uniref:hypothetical protein n=1 Tax=Acetivibrio cellulolyticus TaxID=35830 RepID=UPI0001E2C284|nr:hypothetical protein [Acetivibrio cellulolyticus]